MKLLLQIIKCLLGRHVYMPSPEIVALGMPKFRYRCACCQQETPWMTISEHKQFLDTHKPDWKNAF